MDWQKCSGIKRSYLGTLIKPALLQIVGKFSFFSPDHFNNDFY